MNNTAGPHRRRNYFIEKKFQADFILKFCLLVTAGGSLTICLVYFLAAQATTVSIVHSRVAVRSTADFILPVLIQTVAVTVVLVGLATIVVALLFSHKIAGPLYRFKKVLEALEQGDFSSAFKIRTLDQLQILAGSLNGVVVKNRDQLIALKKAFKSLEKDLEALSEGAPDSQKGRLNEALIQILCIRRTFSF